MAEIRVADEVWVATALLHKENAEREAFSGTEIVDRVFSEGIEGRFRPGVQVHVYQHCVANKRPNPGTYRMLYATKNGLRRLFRRGDDFHPYRAEGKITPRRQEIPEMYRYLVEWYHEVYDRRRTRPR